MRIGDDVNTTCSPPVFDVAQLERLWDRARAAETEGVDSAIVSEWRTRIHSLLIGTLNASVALTRTTSSTRTRAHAFETAMQSAMLLALISGEREHLELLPVFLAKVDAERLSASTLS